MDIEKAKEYIINKLENELPGNLSYHNIAHVMDVYGAVMRHIEATDLQGDDALLLRTAALFHDSGFIVRAAGHEEISCSFAIDALPNFGYSASQIEAICGMIRATKIPQSPKNHLEEILADADLDYLGRDDFFTISDNLFLELKNTGIVTDKNKWNQMQVAFFESHHYFTQNAKDWRQQKKELHLQQIKSEIT